MTKRKYETIVPGEIWWVDLSRDLGENIGHETQKNRPCLVIANCSNTKFLIIIPFQSNLNANHLPLIHI
jgi:mRNA-degrading endonuclease toxin of MazEF toxin-antitoxin module